MSAVEQFNFFLLLSLLFENSIQRKNGLKKSLCVSEQIYFKNMAYKRELKKLSHWRRSKSTIEI
jgi:hypothetical protein